MRRLYHTLIGRERTRARRPRRLNLGLERVEERVLLSFATEQLIHPPNTGIQTGAANASLPNGTSVAVWCSMASPNNGDIYA